MAINGGMSFSWYANSKHRITAVKYGFTLLGIGMLIGAYLLYKNTEAFIEHSWVANGIVVELVQSRSSDSITYKPIIEFETGSGERIEFVSTTSSNPPSYSTGESVEVIYQQDAPNKAKINSFLYLWLGPLMLAGLGGVFFTTGFSLVLYTRTKHLKTAQLQVAGVAVKANYQSVERNASLTVNGKHPFKITAQWINPATGELHIFESDNIWFDPTNYIKTEQLTVLIENGNPKKYSMDVDFLPKMVN